MSKLILTFLVLTLLVFTNSFALTAKEIYSKIRDSIYTVYAFDLKNKKIIGAGSAVAITENILATNCHVANASNTLVVKLNDSDNFKHGMLLYNETNDDLCLIGVDNVNFKPVNLRKSADVEIGEIVYAIGNPHFLEKTISDGIISNKEKFHEGYLLHTTAQFSEGSSGGGLFDTDGNLVGITTGSKNGSRYAIPSEFISVVVNIQNEVPQQNKKSSSINATLSNQASSNLIQKIGTFGKDKIELYKTNTSCFIAIYGLEQDKDRSIKIISLWNPKYPQWIVLFPFVHTVDDAIRVSRSSNIDLSKEIISYSYLKLDETIYDLRGIFNGEIFIRLATKPIPNLTDKLIEADSFMVQLKDVNKAEGFDIIIFGLYGFNEAIESYKAQCY